MTQQIQAIWIDLTVLSEEEGAEYCREHNFKTDVVRYREEDGVESHAIFPQFDTSEVIEGSWRTISNNFPQGISATTGDRREMPEKSYSTFEIKSYDEDERVIRGIASTPETDREGDIVEPKGGRFALPVPLLSQHDHAQPVGMVTEANVTDKGIEIEASLAKGSGLPYVERTWRQVKAGLLRGLSIGFRADDVEPIKSGRRFKSWEWLELSLVTVPANAGAGVSSVKQYDDPAIDLEEQLLEAEMRREDVMKAAAAAIETINSTLNK
jgi:HK97 family phage prohead protease